MDISVQGYRTSSADWDEVKNLSDDKLPPLSPEQREVAAKMGIPERDYARSFLAGQRTMVRMVQKTERFARYLHERFREITPQVSVDSVTLNTWDGRFDVGVHVGDHSTSIRVAEELVDGYFDSGSPEMRQRLDHVLNLATHAQVV
jgi:hypothetical protein